MRNSVILKRLMALAAMFALALASQAALVNTGIDSDNDGIDDNWTVSQQAPIITPPGDAYVVNAGYPLGVWLANDTVSKWIAPQDDPLPNVGNSLWAYEQTFSVAAIGGSLLVRWASDNQSFIRVNDTQGVTTAWNRPALNSFATWNDWLDIGPWLEVGDNIVQIWVANPANASIAPSPTGVRVEVVPEPATVIAGALLLVPFGVSTIRMLRRRMTA